MDPVPVTVTTPTGVDFHGETVDTTDIVAVSIIRAGDSLLGELFSNKSVLFHFFDALLRIFSYLYVLAESFINCVPDASVGKILIQRNEQTAQPELFYSKIPLLHGKRVVLLDPMLATGGSARCAIEVLIDAGADPRNITFVTVLSCPEGLSYITSKFPGMIMFSISLSPSLG
jgi:uracil phosphoribosyltransferase